ncbi:MAG TPA: hypothetical protein VK610_00230 [Rhodothermales bacterium]|nr:hypothetical protein [Rhodothermales bacterium]
MRPLLVLAFALSLAACTGEMEGDDGAYVEDDTLGVEEMDGVPDTTAVMGPAFVLDGDTLSPLAFEALLPNMESGQPEATSVALDTVAAGGWEIEDGWYHADRGEGLGFVDYRYLGESDGRHAFLVRENGGGSLSRAVLFLLSFDGGEAQLQGWDDVENLRDHPVYLSGDSLYYDEQAVTTDDLIISE